MKYLKNGGLLLLYFLAFQIALGFLLSPIAVTSISVTEGFPVELLEQAALISSIIGFVLLIGLTILLWKVLFPRKKVQFELEDSWLTKISLPLLTYVAFFIFQLLVPISESNNQQTVVALIKDFPFHAFLAVVIFAPILEELLFRGFLATYFFPRMANRKTVYFYIATSGTLFSTVHGPSTLPQFLIYFALGAILAWLYVSRRDIRYPMALHAVNNLIAYLLVIFLS